MSKTPINVGTTANDGTGDSIRVGGQSINSNFTELYNGLGDGSTLSFDLNTQSPTDGQALVYNAASGKFRPGTAGVSSTFVVAGDGGSNQSISTGDTLTIQGATGITTTGVATDILSVAIDSTVATLTGSQILTNKTINSANNTLTIANAALVNSTIIVTADSGSQAIDLGDTLTVNGLTGITTTQTGDTLEIDLDDTAVSPNTYGSSTAVPVLTIDQQGRITNASTSSITTTLTVSDASSTQASVALASNVLGFIGTNGITTLVEPGNKTIQTKLESDYYADNYLASSALIDVTNSGASAYLFNSHYTGNNPTLYLRAGHTYALKLNNVTGHPFHLQTVSGAYDGGNSYTTGLTHVATDGTITTGASALLQVSGTLYIEVPSGTSSTIYYVCQNHSAMAGKIVLGSITDKSNTGDGSTTAFTINSGRTVDDLLVIVNGIILVPTDDYTISGTTLTFQTAPVNSAEIVFRYL
jgi:hypothetical protein